MAMTKMVIEGSSVTASQLKDFFRQIDEGSITAREVQAMLEHRNPWPEDKSQNELLDLTPEIWTQVYELLGIKANFSGLDLSIRENLWTVPVLKGITADKIVYGLLKARVDINTSIESLDGAAITLGQDPTKLPCVVRFWKTLEADREQRTKSAYDLDACGEKGITLPQRLLLELAYFLMTAKHLDQKTSTLCSGSRLTNGFVPVVSWSQYLGALSIGCCHPDYREKYLSPRIVFP
jgi:hypothetical protein